MTYRVSRHPEFGDWWWHDHETIPATHASRPATVDEAAVIDTILAQARGGEAPEEALGQRLGALFAAFRA